MKNTLAYSSAALNKTLGSLVSKALAYSFATQNEILDVLMSENTLAYPAGGLDKRIGSHGSEKDSSLFFRNLKLNTTWAKY